MEYLVSSAVMKRCDRETIETYGMSSLVLMERAALAVAEELCDGSFDLSKVLVVCGAGNNGGDGYAIARLLEQRNVEIAVLFAGKEEMLTEETRIQQKICENYGIKKSSNSEISEYTCIVDALFGIGVSREITGSDAELIDRINASGAAVLAVDMPSGILADTGKVSGRAVKAVKTVTFGFRKIGQVLYPGANYCGETIVRDIGITAAGFLGDAPAVYSLTGDACKMLPRRHAYSNKGSYGKVLLIAGQYGMSGAAYLAGSAAYRSGTGLVRIFTEACNRVILQSQLPEAVLTTYEADTCLQTLETVMNWGTAVGIGPGLGISPMKATMLAILLEKAHGPLVLDADALNLLAAQKERLKKCKQEIIITPHIGEMMRLTGMTKIEITENLLEVCKNFAKEYGVICVLKDARTIISDGHEICINQTGNDGMAKGGSGDVLLGLLTGLLAQGMTAFEAAKLAVYLHGKAGDEARKQHGSYGMLAGDIVNAIPALLNQTTR